MKQELGWDQNDTKSRYKKSKQTVQTSRSSTAGAAGVFYSFIFYSMPTLEHQEKKDKLKISFRLLSAL